MIKGIKVSQFHTLTKDAQRKEHRAIYKQAYPSVFEEKKAITWEELSNRLAVR